MKKRDNLQSQQKHLSFPQRTIFNTTAEKKKRTNQIQIKIQVVLAALVRFLGAKIGKIKAMKERNRNGDK